MDNGGTFCNQKHVCKQFMYRNVAVQTDLSIDCSSLCHNTKQFRCN